jgi:glycosyltransferase involved in cell wall biosynthesis
MLATTSRLLVFMPCYNERDNIGSLIEEIVSTVPQADILLVDDNSPDGTLNVILEKQKTYPQIKAVRRARKLGIATAHKYALIYAIREGYGVLITMPTGPTIRNTFPRCCKLSRRTRSWPAHVIAGADHATTRDLATSSAVSEISLRAVCCQ